jgi:hypothetical protein
MEAFGTPSITIKVSGTNYAQWKATDIEGLALEFTPAAENVSFAFSNVIGDLYLVDAANNSKTQIVDGQTYDFTVATTEVGTANATRFSISKVAPVVPEFCFKYEKLTVNGHAGKTLKISKDGTDVVAEFTLGDTYEYDFKAEAAGRYVVTFGGKEYQIDVKPVVNEVKP